MPASRKNSGKLHTIRVRQELALYLEILRPWYGKKFDKQINACRGIQDALGDLHELDLLGGVLSDYPGGKNSVSGRAAFILRRKYAALRNESYSKFIKIWDEASREHLWETLRREA
jgi:CHAD domain-containing protein